MSKYHTFEGTVIDLGELFTAPSGFKKRTIAVRDDAANGKFENVIPFTAKKDNVDLIGGLRVGDRVRIDYTMDGRKWDDPKTGKTRYFLDLSVKKLLRIGADGNAGVPTPAEPTDDDITDTAEDMPF